MKTARRIIALVGVIVLAGLYIAVLVFAIIGNENTMNLFWAALVATFILPVLLWAYSFIYKLLKRDYSEEARAQEAEMKAAIQKERERNAGNPEEKKEK